MQKFLSLDEFHAAAKTSEQPGPIQAQFVDEIEAKADAETTRKLTFTISTASVDREKDVISLDGWDLKNFNRNPVFLWAHNYRQIPLGRSSEPFRQGGKLKAQVEFTPKGLDLFNDTVFELYKQGFMRAVSVGFRPIKWNWNEERSGGIDFNEQELLEFSAVPVPANPEALMDAKSAGIDVEPVRRWAIRTLLAIEGPEMPRSEAPAATMAIDVKSLSEGLIATIKAALLPPTVNIEHLEASTRPKESHVLANRLREIEILKLR